MFSARMRLKIVGGPQVADLPAKCVRRFATPSGTSTLKKSDEGALKGLRILDLSRVLAVGPDPRINKQREHGLTHYRLLTVRRYWQTMALM